MKPVPVHGLDAVPGGDGYVRRGGGAGVVACQEGRVVLEDGVDGSPGALDEPRLAYLVLKLAVWVIAAGGGLELATASVWRKGTKKNLPAIPGVADGVVVEAPVREGPRGQKDERPPR